MTALDIYFIATLCPVIVCVATETKIRCPVRRKKKNVGICVLLTLPNVPSAISWITVYSPSFDGGYGVNWSLISGPETVTEKLEMVVWGINCMLCCLVPKDFSKCFSG
jgi:hypothetical protein